MLFSRVIPTDTILEIVGDKTNINLMIQYLSLFEHMFINQNIVKSLWEFMTTFKMAGVESQTVERVLE